MFVIKTILYELFLLLLQLQSMLLIYVTIILQTNKTNKTYNERYLLYRTYYKR